MIANLQVLHSRNRFKLFIALGLFLIPTSGCHSAFIQTTITNQTTQPIRLFEIDYPSASFGGQDLAPNAIFHYRFKVLGQGPTKLIWTSGSGEEHASRGPVLQEGQEGTLLIAIHASDAHWDSNLRLR